MTLNFYGTRKCLRTMDIVEKAGGKTCKIFPLSGNPIWESPPPDLLPSRVVSFKSVEPMIIPGFVISIRIIPCTYFTTLCSAACPCLYHPKLKRKGPGKRRRKRMRVCLCNGGLRVLLTPIKSPSPSHPSSNSYCHCANKICHESPIPPCPPRMCFLGPPWREGTQKKKKKTIHAPCYVCLWVLVCI